MAFGEPNYLSFQAGGLGSKAGDSGDWLLKKTVYSNDEKGEEVKKAARGHFSLSPVAKDKVVLLAYLTISINQCDYDAD